MTAQQAQVAAGVDHALMDPSRSQRLDGLIDGKTLGDAAEVKLHAGLVQAHDALDVIETYTPVVNQRQGGFEFT